MEDYIVFKEIERVENAKKIRYLSREEEIFKQRIEQLLEKNENIKKAECILFEDCLKVQCEIKQVVKKGYLNAHNFFPSYLSIFRFPSFECLEWFKKSVVFLILRRDMYDANSVYEIVFYIDKEYYDLFFEVLKLTYK